MILDPPRPLVPLLLATVLVCILACPEPRSEDDAAVGAATGGSEDWPGWGGPRHDFHVAVPELADEWPITGPPRIWKRELGPGYSAIAASRGRLYTIWRDGDEDVVVALRADDGETVWSRRYDAPPRDGQVLQFGTGPNASPLVIDDRLVTLSYDGLLHGLSLEDGAIVWRHDLVEEFGADPLDFGHSASPIEHDGLAIVLVGGSRMAVAAFDPGDGSVVWGSPPGSVSYASPRVIEVDGQEQVAYFSADEIIGLDAATGEKLWSRPSVNRWKNNATDPVWGEDGLLWVATQPDGGTRMLRLMRDDRGVTRVEEVWSDPGISIHYWNSIRIGDTVYASIGDKGSILAAVDAATGTVLWKERGFSQANLIHAGDKTLFLDDQGNLALARLSRDGLEMLSQATISDGQTWTVPTLVGTRLYVRDESAIQAFDLSPREPAR